jgi:DNA repair protein RadC
MSVYLIRELPEGERPRERLLEHGGASLADSELLAVLLRTGRKGVSALQMAMDLLRESGGLAGLLTATPHSLRRNGIGPAKAAALLAAVEIGRRLAREQLLDREPLSRPVDVARYLALRYHTCDQEVMGALFLDARSHLLGEREIFRGTMSRISVEPREILRECLQRGASSVYLFHTHPSGDPSPSAEDVLFTRRIAEAAEIVGLRLADHVVLGSRGRWVSLKERAKSAW